MSNIYSAFTDGGARGNPGQGAIGGIIKTERGEVLTNISRSIGVCTNNEAEYLALIETLTAFVSLFAQKKLIPSSVINFYLDSTLIVNQVNGLFKVKDSRMREFLLKVRELESQIPAKIYYRLIPREKNREADFLVNQALDNLQST